MLQVAVLSVPASTPQLGMAGEKTRGGAAESRESRPAPVPEGSGVSWPTVGAAVVATCAVLLASRGWMCPPTPPPAPRTPQSRPLVDCHPQPGASPAVCDKRECLWEEREGTGPPPCVYPEGRGYRMVGRPQETEGGVSVRLERISAPAIVPSPAFPAVRLLVEFHTRDRLRLKFYPENVQRYEVPQEALNITRPSSPPEARERLYDVTFVEKPQFGVVVKRRSTQSVIFSTALPGLELADQFLQVAVRLPRGGDLFGLGEQNHRRLRHDLRWKTWSMFSHDLPPEDEANLYGVHPVYMSLEKDGNAHMVFLKNSNAMEVALQPEPHPAMTWRTVGGVLDFYLFLGPSPQEAVQQYTLAVGRPTMPPYWALGFHLCRWGYLDLADMQMVINRTRAAGIPYDGQWADVEYMHKKFAFTYDHDGWKNLPAVIDDLHEHHEHFVVIIDPGIGADAAINKEAGKIMPGFNMFEDGIREKVFILNSSGDPIIGKVWPGATAFPDFTNPLTQPWWQKWIHYLHSNLSVKFDALWIDMNEPASFVHGSQEGCQDNRWERPPYLPYINGRENGWLVQKTICMSSSQTWGRHYDVHSLYAHSEAIQTDRALRALFPGQRPWLMTRSSFAGTGKYATKWLGDNDATWADMRWSIVGLMEFSMFGFAMNGADICGFFSEAEYEMCLRWHQLGAFYPFSRNHNARTDKFLRENVFPHQDPAAWDDRFVASVRRALLTRYRLLPYLYTQLYAAHSRGDTVTTPLFFHYPRDRTAVNVDQQFLLGPALLISPVLHPGVTSVRAYFPNDRWFNYFTGEEVKVRGGHVDLATPLESFNLHVRGGHVLPWQEPATNTFLSRQNPMGLLVALDDAGRAKGELYWDSGESDLDHSESNHLLVKFSVREAGRLEITRVVSTYREADKLRIETIDLYGLRSPPTSITVNGQRHHGDVRQEGKVIKILGLKLKLTNSSHQVIQWTA